MNETTCLKCKSGNVLSGKLLNGEWDFHFSPSNRKRGLLGFESYGSNPKLDESCFLCPDCGLYWGRLESPRESERAARENHARSSRREVKMDFL